MSVIHSSSELLGRRWALRDGTARCNTVTSMAMSRVGSMSTASPIHSRRPARGGVFVLMRDRFSILTVITSPYTYQRNNLGGDLNSPRLIVFEVNRTAALNRARAEGRECCLFI